MAGAEQGVMEEGWPIFIPSTDDKWGQFHSKNYPVTEQSRLNRVALVINNQRFDDHKDEHNMLDLLQNLQYEVVKYNRLTAQEIGDALIKFSSHPKLPLTDSVFVVIMSNGDSRVLFGIDHEEFKIDHIYEHLSTKNCPALLNKPKVIIIQSCSKGKQRPMMRDRGSTDIRQEKSSVPVRDPLVHKERDFISIVSCTRHTVYKSPRYGSSFIQDIVEVFNTFSQDEHIEVLFKKVIEDYEDSSDRTEMVIKERCTLTKYFYLFPDDPQVNVDPITAGTKPEEPPALFEPEVEMKSGKVSYRFKCPGSGLFQCSLTGLVFDMREEAELVYRIIQWDQSLLQPAHKTPAGPLFDIMGCEAAVRQLHFPHCETEKVSLSDDLISVIHFSDDGMSILEMLKITDTHVIVDVPHLSAFGLVWDFIERFWGIKNPVKAQHLYSHYIPVPSNCKLIKDQTYTVRCPTAKKIQPEKAEFDVEFGPNYYPTFQIRLALNTSEAPLTVQEQTGRVAWKHDVDLMDVHHSPIVSSIKLQDLHQSNSLERSSSVTSGSPERNVPPKEVLNDLLNILNDLNDEDFRTFKWHLKSESWGDTEPIKVNQLSKTERCETVDLMIQNYKTSGAVQVMDSILKKINRNDLVDKFRLLAIKAGLDIGDNQQL